MRSAMSNHSRSNKVHPHQPGSGEDSGEDSDPPSWGEDFKEAAVRARHSHTVLASDSADARTRREERASRFTGEQEIVEGSGSESSPAVTRSSFRSFFGGGSSAPSPNSPSDSFKQTQRSSFRTMTRRPRRKSQEEKEQESLHRARRSMAEAEMEEAKAEEDHRQAQSRLEAIDRDIRLASMSNQREAWEERTLKFLANGNARAADGTSVNRWVQLQTELEEAKMTGKVISEESKSMLRGVSNKSISTASHAAKLAEEEASKEREKEKALREARYAQRKRDEAARKAEAAARERNQLEAKHAAVSGVCTAHARTRTRLMCSFHPPTHPPPPHTLLHPVRCCVLFLSG